MGGTSPGCHRPGSPSTEEEERSQPGHSRRAEASLSPAPTEAVGRPPRETQRGGAAQQGAFQGREEPAGQASSLGTTGGSDKGHTESVGGASPTFPWMQDIPERLRLRLGWTPRPAPGSSKPSLILL